MSSYKNIESALIHGGIYGDKQTGAVLSAAEKLIAKGIKGNIVIILPDRGDRYFSKHLYE